MLLVLELVVITLVPALLVLILLSVVVLLKSVTNGNRKIAAIPITYNIQISNFTTQTTSYTHHTCI